MNRALGFLLLMLGVILGSLAMTIWGHYACNSQIDSIFELERELEELAPLPQPAFPSWKKTAT